MIYSEVSGIISEILVSKNQHIDIETNLLVIECMKMLIPVTSNKKGKVIEIFVNEGDFINEGDKLLSINYVE